ncbi:MAG: hypothetical protein N2556_03905, partial [Anaerolineae bacterium]|nr:hypothetical protein [Anaerolineae bacterium]
MYTNPGFLQEGGYLRGSDIRWDIRFPFLLTLAFWPVIPRHRLSSACVAKKKIDFRCGGAAATKINFGSLGISVVCDWLVGNVAQDLSCAA